MFLLNGFHKKQHAEKYMFIMKTYVFKKPATNMKKNNAMISTE